MLFLSFTSVNAKTKEIILTEDNTIVLNTAFTGDSVSELMGQAIRLDSDLKSGYPIYLFLNTPGGGIQAGLELIEFFKGVNRPVHTVTLFAASMGWQLVQGLGERYILQYGLLMAHKAAGGFQGEFGGGSSQIDSRYTMWLRRLGMMDQRTVDRTKGKKTLKQYHAEYDNEMWLNGPEAVSNGYADAVVSVKCGKGLRGTQKSSSYMLGFSVDTVMSKCPIRTSPVAVRSNVRTNQGIMSLDDFLQKSGIFGPKCRNEKITTENFDKITVKEKQLCLIEKTLTLEKLQKAVIDTKRAIRSKNNKIIKMSFGGFVQEL